jgi:hypothetical protein
MLGFDPTASLVGSREKLGYGPVDRSAGVLWIVSGALFLGSSGPAQLC